MALTPIGGGRVVCWIGHGLVAVANPDVATPHALPVCGVTKHAVSNGGERVEVQQAGPMDDSSWNWTPMQPVYLGANGVLTQVYNAAWKHCVVIGTAVSPTCLCIAIRSSIRQV